MNILAKFKKTISLACFSVCSASLVQAQQPSGSLTGIIICNDGNFPARGATVALIPMGRILPGASRNATANSATTATDFSGSYEFWSVDPGTYILNATFDGYGDDLKLVSSVLEHLSVDDRKSLLASLPQVTIKPATNTRQDLVLRRAASISGHVSVDLGGTTGNRQVTASLVSGNLVGTASTGSNAKSIFYSQSAATDDREYYRIAGLPPGKYRLSVALTQSYFEVRPGDGEKIVPQPQRPGVADLTVFAPDALEEAAAKLVEVKDGDEITDDDITVPTRLLHSIAGIVTRGGAPIGGIDVSVQRSDGSVQGRESITMPDGNYRFDLLPPGAYTIRASPTGLFEPNRRPFLGQVSVQLSDADLLDANIDFLPRLGGKQ